MYDSGVHREGNGRLLRAATRGSRLALWQTDFVATQLSQAWPGLTVEAVHNDTRRDRMPDVPLSRIGDKGLFTRELEDALRAGTVQFAVHSLKDLPTSLAEGMTIAAMLERGDPRDALVAREPATLASLTPGARVGTCSLRRRAQLLALRPDLEILDLSRQRADARGQGGPGPRPGGPQHIAAGCSVTRATPMSSGEMT